MERRKPELVAPAGDLEKLYFAFAYGADAVYAGGKEFSLRAGAGNFSLEELKTGLAFAHERGKKLYLAVNIFPRNEELKALPGYLEKTAALGVDALIISDPGIFSLAQEYAPHIPIHISTQANNVNWRSARFWQQAGAKRAVLGRELSFKEIQEISAQGGLETEIFVHGAICIAYSGRCLLSSFLSGRHANAGDCAHPCRWKYALQEEKRPGEFFPIEEDGRGAYIFNSKDLCLLPYMGQLISLGAHAFKIEGRNKSAYYIAAITRAYRLALDAAWEEGAGYQPAPFLLEEIRKISHRDYTAAFALEAPGGAEYRYEDGGYMRAYDFAAIVREADGAYLTLEQRNHLAVGDEIEILLPQGGDMHLKIEEILDEDGANVPAANHPKKHYRIPCQAKPPVPAIVRRKQRGS